tara:strand:+ start:1700 stop:1951 length:252 start_codon:yes stop_codon:yes gene_type:complete
MSKKIEQSELEELVKQQSLKSRMLTDIGTLEVQKTQILGSFAQLLADAEKTSKDLEKKYGKITVNLEDGSYEEMKSESDEQAN